MKAIVNGKILLKDRVVEGCALLYSDVIEGIVPMEQLPEEIPVIDADGGYISPGLIDLHIHGYLGCDVCDGEESSIRTISKGLLANGVTGYLPTTMTVDMAVIRRALDVCRSLKEESQSWEGGAILLDRAQEVLDKEFPALAQKIALHIPDEKSRRVGQSVAAASLPKIK